jgi:hydroxymethylbilane synthase
MQQTSDTKPTSIRIGTRGSKLAIWQANWVAEQLAARGIPSELVTISTRGDQQPDGLVASLGSDGVFTKELQKALLDGRIDVAVHSLKDLPTDPVEGIVLAAVPIRESPFDVLVSRTGQRFDRLPIGALLGTGSLRRRAQLLHARPDLKFSELRGNIDTRLRKLREGQVDALVLAEAGLKRLGCAAEITEVFTPEIILPAVGQGALAIEVRSGDQPCLELLAQVDDSATHKSIIAERTLLATLRGGCLAPIGAWGRVEDDGRLHLTACVLSGDGSRRLFADCFGNVADAAAVGRQAAEKLLAEGANKLIEQSRGN